MAAARQQSLRRVMMAARQESRSRERSRAFAQEHRARTTIDNPARARTRSDRGPAGERGHHGRADRAADRDREQQAEQDAAREQGERRHEDQLRRAARLRFVGVVTLACIAAATWSEGVAYAMRRRASPATHHGSVGTVGARSNAHPEIVPQSCTVSTWEISQPVPCCASCSSGEPCSPIQRARRSKARQRRSRSTSP